MLDFAKIINIPSPIEKLEDIIFEENELEIYVKRDDLTHSLISGNKFRKLKYNLEFAKINNKKRLVTFGGAFSNHILAVASAGNLFGFQTMAYIRGDELNENSSHTLINASKLGMRFDFISRAAYRLNKNVSLLDSDYLIPEGGSNTLALKGISEMVNECLQINNFDFMAVAMGTGGTLAGMLCNENYKGKVLGIPVLKSAEFLIKDIENLIESPISNRAVFNFDYHFGGYSKSNKSLTDFVENFELKYKILLDPVYTSKLFYAVFDLISKNYFPKKSKILLIHTGGLQGIMKK